jgi:hypothetical protein
MQKKPFKQRLLNKYRLVVLNEETYEERISYKLNKLNVFLLIAFASTILIMTTIVLIVYTPIKEYIPGYDSTVLRQTACKKHRNIRLFRKGNSKEPNIYKFCWVSYFRRSISRGAFKRK